MSEQVSPPGTGRFRACAAAELELGRAKLVRVAGRDLCLARCEDGIHAVDDLCSHEDYSLAEGEVDPTTCEVECWAHGSVFSLHDGEPQNLPATRPVGVYAVEVDGDDVYVVVPG
ncbi:MAG: Rieske 2Fe-2S domain-containing protein [Actinomycetota bacterium]|nr:Rieske 2Fe-2S domain-containing protein [Actinomycetota bacterium]